MSACIDCGAALPVQSGRGRPRKYCATTCRPPAPRKPHTPSPKSIGANALRQMKRRAAHVLVESGWTLTDAAKVLGYACAASLRGIPARSDPVAERNQRIAELYRSGQTLDEIGLQFNVTRERVRQVLQKAGLSGHRLGGAHVRAASRSLVEAERRAKRQAEKCAKLNATAMKLFGCDRGMVTTLNGGTWWKQQGTKANCYQHQKRSAGQRGIDWLLTFPEWCRIWDESGKWHERGRGRGRYCMARRGDTGPYSVDNVQIITNDENIAESYRVRPWAERFPTLSAKAGEKMIAAYNLRAEGKSCKEVAAALGIKHTTVPGYALNGKRILEQAA